MASKTIYFVILLVAFSIVVDHAEAGWKFWKKKKDDTSTTVAPEIGGDPQAGAPNPSTGVAKPTAGLNPTTSPPVSPSRNSPRNDPASGAPSTGTRGAIAGAANPGLAIGVGNTGDNIRGNARPQRPNPGTEVGLDIPGPRPTGKPATGGTSGQGYRDWAADLTGAGNEGSRQPPKLPSQPPAVGTAGNRPGSPTSTTPGGIGQQQPVIPTNKNGQNPPALGPRPGSPTGGQAGQLPSGQGTKPAGTAGKPNSQGTGTPDGTHVSSLNIGTLNPGQNRPGSPASSSSSSSGYGSPGSSQPASPTGVTTPTGGKSWAEVAGNGGNSRPGSPTPTPRSGSVQPAVPSRPVQPLPYGRPTSTGGGPTGQTTGSGLGGRTGAAGAAVAGGAIAAGAAATGVKYSSNPIYSKGKTVTDDDLEKLSEALWLKDTNNANSYITLNLQKQTTGSNTADQATQPLLTVNPRAMQIPTISKVLTIYDNYKLDSRTHEHINPLQRAEESLLIDTFLSTGLMSAAMRFLADKGFLRKDYYDYKDTLRTLWFNLYSRGEGKVGSTGFEHVFLAELKLGTEVSGLHNWIYYNSEEVAKRADYLGYIKKVDLGDKASIVKIHTKFNNIDKPVTSMFIGTSPELEMALYTVCFYARPNGQCPVSLGGTKFNIATHKFRYRGNDLVGSAYPDI